MPRRKKDFDPHIESHRAHACEAPGCAEAGLYKAPRNRSDLRSYRYFCLEHIREHNKQWDYFAGMNEAEIEAFMKDAVTGHRPTWERAHTIANPQEALYAALNDFIGSGKRKTADHPKLPAKIKKSLALFELEYPYTATTLKRRYKELAKQFHPDKNKGDKLAEEKFKAVAEAYKVLAAHLET